MKATKRRKTTELPLPSVPCACSTLRRTARAVTQLYEEELRPVHLRVTQFTLLMALSHTEGITQGRLGELLALDSTTLTRMLKLLEKEGWIRSAPGSDRRERHLCLTSAGKGKLEQALTHWEKAQARLRHSLGQRHWRTLNVTLDKITQAAQQA
jgi:DNA-binding MarR family transcriptional regulator